MVATSRRWEHCYTLGGLLLGVALGLSLYTGPPGSLLIKHTFSAESLQGSATVISTGDQPDSEKAAMLVAGQPLTLRETPPGEYVLRLHVFRQGSLEGRTPEMAILTPDGETRVGGWSPARSSERGTWFRTRTLVNWKTPGPVQVRTVNGAVQMGVGEGQFRQFGPFASDLGVYFALPGERISIGLRPMRAIVIMLLLGYLFRRAGQFIAAKNLNNRAGAGPACAALAGPALLALASFGTRLLTDYTLALTWRAHAALGLGPLAVAGAAAIVYASNRTGAGLLRRLGREIGNRLAAAGRGAASPRLDACARWLDARTAWVAVFLFAAAFAFRAHDIASMFSGGLSGDERYDLNANFLEFMADGKPGNRAFMYYFWLHLAFSWLGWSHEMARLFFCGMNSLAVVFAYLTFRRLFNSLVALAACVLACFSGYLILFSKFVLITSSYGLPLFAGLYLYALALDWERRQGLSWRLAGLAAMGAAAAVWVAAYLSYPAAAALFLIPPGVGLLECLLLFIRERRRGGPVFARIGWIVLTVGVFVAAGAIAHRAILTFAGAAAPMLTTGGGSFDATLPSVWSALKILAWDMFVNRWSMWLMLGDGPVLERYIQPFFAMGFAGFCVLAYRDAARMKWPERLSYRHVLIPGVLLAGVALVAVSGSYPGARRAIHLLYFAYLLAAAAMVWAARHFRGWAPVVLIVLVAGAGWDGMDRLGSASLNGEHWHDSAEARIGAFHFDAVEAFREMSLRQPVIYDSRLIPPRLFRGEMELPHRYGSRPAGEPWIQVPFDWLIPELAYRDRAVAFSILERRPDPDRVKARLGRFLEPLGTAYLVSSATVPAGAWPRTPQLLGWSPGPSEPMPEFELAYGRSVYVTPIGKKAPSPRILDCIKTNVPVPAGCVPASDVDDRLLDAGLEQVDYGGIDFAYETGRRPSNVMKETLHLPPGKSCWISGWLCADASCVAELSLSADDGARLYLGGCPLIDLWGDHPVQSATVAVELRYGKVAVDVLHYNKVDVGVLRLGMRPLSGPAPAFRCLKPKEERLAILLAGRAIPLDGRTGEAPRGWIAKSYQTAVPSGAFLVGEVAHPKAEPAANQYNSCNFSFRWESWMRVEKDSLYRFNLASRDGSRLWMCGEPILDTWAIGGSEGHSIDLLLKPGWYPVQLDYAQEDGGGSVEFEARCLGDGGSDPVFHVPPPE